MTAILSVLVGFCFLLLGALAWVCHAVRTARAEHAAAMARRDSVQRAVRAAVSELSLIALSLRGAAIAPARDDAGLVVLAARLVALADILQDETALGAAPVIRPEPLDFGPMLTTAIAQVAAVLEPGRRIWRVGPEVHALTAVMDRRAVQAILLRLAANAAYASRDGDWVELRIVAEAGGQSLVIEDEGMGTLAGFASSGQRDSRGAGLGLSLARSLIEAQGGTLAVEGAPGVGARVTWRWPSPPGQPSNGARSTLERDHAVAVSSSNSSANFFMTVPPSSSASTIVTARR